MKRILIALTVLLGACQTREATSDDIQQQRQEQILAAGAAEVGMPAVPHHTEQKLMKQIIELRDQVGLVTYTYTYNEMTGKRVFFCNSIGYGLPYATQYTNPQKIAYGNGQYGLILPQADPNGLFTPASAEGTWVLCKDPNSSSIAPIYVEPKVITSPFKLD